MKNSFISSFALIASICNFCFSQNPDNCTAVFRKNMGQWQEKVLFRGPVNDEVTASFMKEGVSFCIGRETGHQYPHHYKYLVWNLYFEGAKKEVQLSAKGEQASNCNYFLGNDSSKWVRNAPDYTLIEYKQIYDNIDLRYYLVNGRLKYDFIIHPGGNIEDIQIRWEGIEGMKMENGAMKIKTAIGNHIEEKPYGYQQIQGKEKKVRVNYRILNDHIFGFHAAQYDKSQPLIIDPLIMVWSTYMKATANTFNNYSYDIAKDANGNIFITGKCDNTFPITAGTYQTVFGGGMTDVFVSKLNRNGTNVLFTTYLGGSAGGNNTDEEARGIYVNNAGEAYITGYTMSQNFPVTAGAFQTTKAGSFATGDLFITKLNATGNNLIYSTYLGGTDDDWGWDIAVNNNGEAYVTGQSNSNNFPVTAGAFQTTSPGFQDAFITKLNAAGSGLAYSTYLGGASFNMGWCIKVNSTGEAYVAGVTNSTGFPTTAGAFQTTFAGSFDGFVTKINSTGAALLYSTYIGGSGDDMYSFYSGSSDMAVNAAGEVFLVGSTTSTDFPVTPGVLQPALNGAIDATVTRLNAAGSGLIYSTYLGGSANEHGHGITVNGSGEAYITGITWSTDFPVTAGAFQATYGGNGRPDMFVAHLCANGQAFCCGGATYVGGNSNDYRGAKVALDETGTADTIMVTGTSHSSNFPTTPGVYQPTKLNFLDYDEPVVFKMTSCAQNPPCTFSASITTIATICGQNNGTATVTPSGGISPYTYQWSNGQTTQTATGLAAGNYTVLITDAGACTATASVTVAGSSALSVLATATQTSCTASTGTATANPTNGSTPYTYLWNNGQTTSTAIGLSAGNYSVTVTDANGCTQTATVAVTQSGGPTVSTSSTPQTCTQGGTATANASGGTAPYTYQWCNGQTAFTATGLSAGNCTVLVSGANGCSTLDTVTVSSSGNVPIVNTSSIPASCNTNNGSATANVSSGTLPYTYSWSNGQTTSTATGLGAGNYTVTITDTNGCTATATATITMNPGFNVSVNGNTSLCTGDVTMLTASGGTTYSWSNGATTTSITLNPSSTATYSVIATDTSGCSDTASITVTVSPSPIAAISGTDTICEGDNVFLTASGGGNYSWNTGATTSSITASATATATYSVVVSIGSCSDTAFHTVNVLQNPTADAGVNVTITQGQNTTLIASGGGTYSWSNGETNAAISVSPTVITVYCVTVTAPNNCSDTACVTVFVQTEPIDCDNAGELFLPNVFSPNGDGENDVLKLHYGNFACIKEIELVIYDRWGEKVFETNDINFQWDGIYNGKVMNSAVVVYYMKAEMIDGKEQIKKGNTSIIQ